MTKIFVIAGNLAEARDWIRKDIDLRIIRGESITLSHYVYVDSSQSRLKGHANPHGVFVGTWRSRTDIKEIVDLLIMASPGGNHRLHLIREELRIGSPKQFVGKGSIQMTGRQAIDQAADDLAKHIDQHLLDEFTRKINGGILRKSSQAIKDIYSD